MKQNKKHFMNTKNETIICGIIGTIIFCYMITIPRTVTGSNITLINYPVVKYMILFATSIIALFSVAMFITAYLCHKILNDPDRDWIDP